MVVCAVGEQFGKRHCRGVGIAVAHQLEHQARLRRSPRAPRPRCRASRAAAGRAPGRTRSRARSARRLRARHRARRGAADRRGEERRDDRALGRGQRAFPAADASRRQLARRARCSASAAVDVGGSRVRGERGAEPAGAAAVGELARAGSRAVVIGIESRSSIAETRAARCERDDTCARKTRQLPPPTSPRRKHCMHEQLTPAAALPADRRSRAADRTHRSTRRPAARRWCASTATRCSTCRRSRRRATSCSSCAIPRRVRSATRATCRAARTLADVLANSRVRRARRRRAVVPRALRPAGDQGGRRHVRREHAGARDRGAGARRSGARPRRCARRSSRSSATTCARASRARPRPRELKDALIAQSAWSQYLEVGIGPDAEIFTKSQPMSAVGTGADDRHPSEVGVEQSRAGDRAGGQQPRRDGGRDARQRRQPARLRGPQRAAARQGEGQQRVVRDRPVHPPVRRALRASTTCAARDLAMRVDGTGRLRARRHRARSSKISRDPLDLVAQAIGAQSPVSRRLHAVPRHDVRADQGPRTGRARASRTWSATS